MVKQKHNITEDLKHLMHSTDVLALDPSNVRKHGTRSIDSIKASLAKFGQRKPVVVQKNGMIVRAGNGTVEAAKSLGWSHVAAVVIDDDNLTATQFAIADNRSAELSEWSYEELGSVLRDLGDSGVALDGLGWSGDELENMLQADWEPPTIDGTQGDDLKSDNGLTVKFTSEQVELMQTVIEEDLTAATIVSKVRSL